LFAPRFFRTSKASSVLLFLCTGALLVTVYEGIPEVFAADAEGVNVTFKTSIADEARAASVELRKISDVAYVAINDVLHQFGGGSKILPGRAELDFLGRSAWVRLNGKSVNASLKQFQVRHDILREDADILMALADVVPFFKDAFGVDVSQEVGLIQRPKEEIREPETVVMEDLTFPETAEAPPLADLDPINMEQGTEHGERRRIEVIVIDAGHGGTDQGCQSAAIVEKDLTLAIARRTARVLQASYDGRVVLTRAQDSNPSLEARARLANAQDGDLIMSIHAGAGFSPSAQGFEIFVPPDARLSAALGEPEPGAKGARMHAAQSGDIAAIVAGKFAEATGATNRGIRVAPCRLFDEVDMASLLVEVGCLTNYAEAPKLAEEAYQMKIAQALADGVLEYAGGLSGNGATP
jgi:N-acetylmuramoyl-L-alanine amidase